MGSIEKSRSVPHLQTIYQQVKLWFLENLTVVLPRGEKEMNLSVALCRRGRGSCARLGFKKNDNLVRHSARALCGLIATALQ